MVTAAQLVQFRKDYNKSKYVGLRFGQAFCNVHGITDDQLFYCEDRDTAEKYIWDKYFKE